MTEELEKLLAEEKKTPDPTLEVKPGQPNIDEETQKKKAHLDNINKAILEANEELKRTRKAKKEIKVEDDELPKIDLEDPNSRAWDKHLESKVIPLQDEMAKEKEEIRTFALQKFIKDYPNLVEEPDKLKRVMATYDRIKTASERTTEGVLIDLQRAYAAENYLEYTHKEQQERMEQAQAEAIFSDAGVSRGSTSYRTEHEASPRLSREDQAILAKWGMTDDEWVKMKKAQIKK